MSRDLRLTRELMNHNMVQDLYSSGSLYGHKDHVGQHPMIFLSFDTDSAAASHTTSFSGISETYSNNHKGASLNNFQSRIHSYEAEISRSLHIVE